MSRSYPLKVEQLEDRCVPSAASWSFSVPMPKVEVDITIDVQPTPQGSGETFHFVIDAYLRQPGPPEQTFDRTLPLGTLWQDSITIYPKLSDFTPTPPPTPTPVTPPVQPPTPPVDTTPSTPHPS